MRGEEDGVLAEKLNGERGGIERRRGTVVVGEIGKGDLSGLSALKRRRIFPIGRTIIVSRLMGTAGSVSLPTYSPASSSERTTV